LIELLRGNELNRCCHQSVKGLVHLLARSVASNKAAKIRAALADSPDASAKEIVQALSKQRVRVSLAQVYNVKATTAKPKVNGYASLIQAKKLVDAMGGVEQARAALDALAKLV